MPEMHGISMEGFGPISVDYYHGRRVESVEDTENGWVIKLEGGAEVHNFDPTIDKPTAIVGAALSMSILGAHQGEDRRPVTELRFGLESVKLNPIEYAMRDSQYTKGQLVYPQRSNANMPQEADDAGSSES
jgi:hypothetical protein